MLKVSVADFFDTYAHDFEAIYGTRNTGFNRFVNRHFRKCMRLRYEKTLEGCRPVEGRRVIDIGCGPGHYGVRLAQMGAEFVCGIDFAQTMLDLAERRAQESGVADRCRFVSEDFMQFESPAPFDYAILMGFMDYVSDAEAVIEKALLMARQKAFFSFPADGGLLAWQRKLRYKSRCDLFMYTSDQIHRLFEGMPCKKYEVERVDRDFMVTAFMA